MPGRCKATNQCGYCARLAAVETSEALALAALEGEAPRVWMVLTTRTATLDVSAFYESFRQVVRAVRRRWPGAQYAAIVEFTTGYGSRSGGRRRPHWNVVWIGLGPEDVDELEELASRVWCSRVDAERQAQFVGEIAEVGGLMRYLALHFLKESQAPPAGWRGHRFRSSRGFFPEGAAVAREKARASLNGKRLRGWLASSSSRVRSSRTRPLLPSASARGAPGWSFGFRAATRTAASLRTGRRSSGRIARARCRTAGSCVVAGLFTRAPARCGDEPGRPSSSAPGARATGRNVRRDLLVLRRDRRPRRSVGRRR